jgi:hypothetical protein
MESSGSKEDTGGVSSFTVIRSCSTVEDKWDLLHVFSSLSCENAVSHLTLVDGRVSIRSISRVMLGRSVMPCNAVFQVMTDRSLNLKFYQIEKCNAFDINMYFKI